MPLERLCFGRWVIPDVNSCFLQVLDFVLKKDADYNGDGCKMLIVTQQFFSTWVCTEVLKGSTRSCSDVKCNCDCRQYWLVL